MIGDVELVYVDFHLLMTDKWHRFNNRIEWRGDTLQVPIVRNQNPCLRRDSWHVMGSGQEPCKYCSRWCYNNRCSSLLVRGLCIHLLSRNNILLEKKILVNTF